MRKKMKKRKDRKIFRNTAVATKKVNISPKVMRGGIRLWKQQQYTKQTDHT